MHCKISISFRMKVYIIIFKINMSKRRPIQTIIFVDGKAYKDVKLFFKLPCSKSWKEQLALEVKKMCDQYVCISMVIFLIINQSLDRRNLENEMLEISNLM